MGSVRAVGVEGSGLSELSRIYLEMWSKKDLVLVERENEKDGGRGEGKTERESKRVKG